MLRENAQNVREIGSLRPRLRADLRFTFQEFGGERTCVLEDPVASKFHRVGLAEYRLMRLLDGRRTFSEATARAAIDSGFEGLDEGKALSLFRWLVQNRLVDPEGGIPSEVVLEGKGRRVRAGVRNAFNILFIKVPFGSPDRFFRAVAPPLGWLCGRAVFLLWTLVVLAGLVTVLLNGDRLREGAEGILGPDNWIWLGVVWLVLKLWHEFWHGLVCRHLGGAVREWGALFVLFMPLGYVDASSSLRFPSKWRRIQVAAAGMYGEFFLAAVAAIVWSQTSPGIVNTISLNTMVMGSVVTLFFNLNPLMRFDGYFILSDWLEIPNLGTRANHLLKRVSKKWILGVRDLPPVEWTLRDTAILLVYGILSFLWRILIVVTLSVAATHLFGGGGLILAVIALLFWSVPPLLKLFGYLFVDSGGERVRLRVALSRILLIGLSFYWIGFIPSRTTLSVEAVVEPAAESVLRAEAPGFVERIAVREGSEVREGDLVLELGNPELRLVRDTLAARIERQRARMRLARTSGQTADFEAEAAVLLGLEKQLAERDGWLESLRMEAPRDGEVMRAGLERLEGTYVRTGDELMRIVRRDSLELVLPVRQEDLDYYRDHIGQPVEILFPGRGWKTLGELLRISGRAATRIDYPGLAAPSGGRLAVMSDRAGGENGGMRLVQPVYWGAVKINSPRAASLRIGERARVRFVSGKRETLGGRFRRGVVAIVDYAFSRAGPV